MTIQQLHLEHAEKMQLLENAMDERVKKMMSESSSRYEELQKEKEEALSQLKLLLDAAMKDCEE
eukprot:4881543-Ditylum_brightwellii.AAC.1